MNLVIVIYITREIVHTRLENGSVMKRRRQRMWVLSIRIPGHVNLLICASVARSSRRFLPSWTPIRGVCGRGQYRGRRAAITCKRFYYPHANCGESECVCEQGNLISQWKKCRPRVHPVRRLSLFLPNGKVGVGGKNSIIFWLSLQNIYISILERQIKSFAMFQM